MVVSKARHKLLAIRRLIPLRKNTTLKLYHAFVVPHLDYCDVAWSPITAKPITRLERVQKLAARIILGADMSTSSFELYSILNWKCLEQHRTFHTAVHVYRALRNLSPPYNCGTFELSFQESNRSLRNNYRIYVPNVTTNLARNGFYFQGATFSLYLCTCLNNFKSTYIQLYIS